MIAKMNRTLGREVGNMRHLVKYAIVGIVVGFSAATNAYAAAALQLNSVNGSAGSSVDVFLTYNADTSNPSPVYVAVIHLASGLSLNANALPQACPTTNPKCSSVSPNLRKLTDPVLGTDAGLVQEVAPGTVIVSIIGRDAATPIPNTLPMPNPLMVRLPISIAPGASGALSMIIDRTEVINGVTMPETRMITMTPTGTTPPPESRPIHGSIPINPLTNGTVTVSGGSGVAQGDLDGDGRFLAGDAFGWIDAYANNQALAGDYDGVKPAGTPNDLELLRRGDCASPHDSRLFAADYFSVLDLIQRLATTCPP
jgi:hypothetical protein